MAAVLVGELLDAPEPYTVELYLLDRRGRMSNEDFFMFFEAFAARTMGLATTRPSRKLLRHPADGECAAGNAAGVDRGAKSEWAASVGGYAQRTVASGPLAVLDAA